MAQWRVIREQPKCIRLASADRYRGVSVFAIAGVMFALFLVAMLGWFGVLDIARDIATAFATLAILAFGIVALISGVRIRWGWCELEIADVAITVVDGTGWRIRRTARIDRPTPGVPLTVVVESDGGGETRPTYWLSVHNGEPYGQPIAIARELELDRGTLEEVAAVVERWGYASPRSAS